MIIDSNNDNWLFCDSVWKLLKFSIFHSRVACLKGRRCRALRGFREIGGCFDKVLKISLCKELFWSYFTCHAVGSLHGEGTRTVAFITLPSSWPCDGDIKYSNHLTGKVPCSRDNSVYFYLTFIEVEMQSPQWVFSIMEHYFWHQIQ